jgi:hypothetical protein
VQFVGNDLTDARRMCSIQFPVVVLPWWNMKIHVVNGYFCPVFQKATGQSAVHALTDRLPYNEHFQMQNGVKEHVKNEEMVF